MKLSEIKRPTRLSIETSELQYEFFVSNLCRNPKTKELEDILIAPTLYVQGNNQTNVQLSPEMCSQSIFEGFNGYTYSLGKLNRLAEINLDKLISFLQIYFSLEGSKDILEKNADCKKCKQYDIENIPKLTFGNLRNILSCIVKTDTSLHHLESLNTQEKRDNFTKIYNGYIEDRDCFTHGIMFFLYPDFKPVLRVKLENKLQYITFEKEVFVSNLEVFNYLTEILNAIRVHVQSKAKSVK